MKKILAILILSIITNHPANAAGPEVWWAIRVTCNQFMKFKGISLTEKEWDKASNKKHYTGHGVDGYTSFTFPDCVADTDDSITCTGYSTMQKDIKFTVSRRNDGTFYGSLQSSLNGGGSQVLGCILDR